MHNCQNYNYKFFPNRSEVIKVTSTFLPESIRIEDLTLDSLPCLVNQLAPLAELATYVDGRTSFQVGRWGGGEEGGGGVYCHSSPYLSIGGQSVRLLLHCICSYLR